MPPPNVGVNTTPEYNDSATRFRSLGRDDGPGTSIRVRQSRTWGGAFAGPARMELYSDIPAIFDLLDGRILDNNGSTADGLERALPIYERDGSNSASVAGVLNGLGNAYGDLGDHAKRATCRSARSRSSNSEGKDHASGHHAE